MRVKKFASLLVIMVMICCVFTTQAENKEPIKIGVLIERSGALETWGYQEECGLLLGFKYATDNTMTIDGRPIELIIEDTTSAVNVGVQKATKLVETDKVDILTGTTNSSIALAVMEIAKQHEVPYIISCAAANGITGENFNVYTFQIGRTVRQVSLANADYLPELGSKFAILYPDYAGGIDFANSWAEDVHNKGLEVIYQEYAPLDCSDFTPWLKAIKDAGPDAGIIGLIGNAFSVKLPQQIKEMNMLKTGIEWIADFADREFYRGIGASGVGMKGTTMYYYSLFDTPENKWFVAEHQKEYGENPDLWAGNSFNGAIAIVEGIRKAGGTDANALISALEGMTFRGCRGEMTIRAEDHLTLQPLPFVELQDLGAGYPEPVLIEMISAENCTPEITAPGR
ncbi:MAG: ABC transporter substrate-binding protein [Christensenellales bacterium]|jgi:branched-chain amino acid transport system substrate-binding protein